ncbi:DUF721 domain-containing protein [Coralliovum pocilloporae]|uniref:DUF721 domain-containing protein n=1 Tax=Coralliovum pocilloporae TaxID=3066369 RepID=UPI0033070A6F
MASYSRPYRKRPVGKPIADLIGDIVDPVCRKRGFATADIVAWWPDIVGERYADCSEPDRIAWPKQKEDTVEQFEPATLHVRISGAQALFFQHEIPQIIDRVNAMFGYSAIGRIRLIQRPVSKPKAPLRRPAPSLDQSDEASLQDDLAGIEDKGLHEALARLGRGIRSPLKKT